jgi:Holliday junction resolvase RusA-like endonuclease
MNKIEFTVLGEPKAQKRHRHGQGRTYDPSKSDKGDFLIMVQKNAPREPFIGPLKMTIHFVFSRPMSHYGTGKNAGVKKPNAPDFHISKPDSDNLCKFAMDALNKIFWKDDSQICDLSCTKAYGERPCTTVVVSSLAHHD